MCLWETCLIMLAASKKACGRKGQRKVNSSLPGSDPKGALLRERPVGPRKAHSSHPRLTNHSPDRNCQPCTSRPILLRDSTYVENLIGYRAWLVG